MPSIMENTIVSFNLAASSGADFVEFDVQVRLYPFSSVITNA
jgi:glycerophosphoryl diester phosphodiesterase